MKRIILILTLISAVIFSCSKPGENRNPDSLDGNWRMIIVKDNNSGNSITKPASIQKNVDLSFTSSGTSGGTFTGFTPTNQMGDNNYTVGADQSISMPSLNITKVAETSWGSEFVDNIRSAHTYSFEEGNLLHIITINKTLTFKRY